jgi:hypothetical protein
MPKLVALSLALVATLAVGAVAAVGAARTIIYPPDCTAVRGQLRLLIDVAPTLAQANRIRSQANARGFRDLRIEKDGPNYFAIVVADVKTLAEANRFRRENLRAGFPLLVRWH